MTAPISPATAEQAEREACESALSERAILLALVKQAEAILQRGENDEKT